MKMSILVLLMILSFTGIYAQKNIAGIWEGKMQVTSFSLRIVFHFEKANDGTYSGKMDSPDQGARGVACENVSLKNDSVIVTIKKGAYFKGHMLNDSLIDGNWEQGGKKIPLTLNKESAVSKNPDRPQTPKPPFNYNSEDLEYDNADKTVHLGATFTYPKGNGPFPTAILITGSGQQDRDETIMGHKSFFVIADYLTKKGYAVLRVDDRGMVKSTGDLSKATSADFANDVETSLNYIKNRKEVDQKKIGLIGHSEGALIACIIASRNADINFVIMLAGQGIKGEDILVKQDEDVLKSYGLPSKIVAEYSIIYKKVIADVLAEKDTAILFQKVINDYKEWKAGQSESTLKALKLSTDNSNDNKIAKDFVLGFTSPWMRYFLVTDPQPMMEKFTCKVLALDGSKDLQVNASINLAAIKKTLKKSKSPVYDTKEIPGLNHLFQHCKKCTVEEYAELEETFAPEALEIMGNWLDKNVK